MKSKQGKQNKMMDKKAKKSKASLPSERNDDVEDDVSSGEEEMEIAKSAKKESGSTKKPNKVKQILKEKLIQEENSDDDEDDDDDDDDMEAENDSEDDEDEDSEDDDDGDDDDEDDIEDSDDDDDEDEEDEEEEEDAKPGQKRKAKQPVKQENKKAKLETPKASDVKSLFVRMMSSDVESSTIEKFFDSRGVKVQQVRRIGGRNFAYVDVSESQLEAGLALSGKKMAGKQVQILLANEKSEKTQEKGQEKTPKTKYDAESKKRTLFVKNIGFDVKEADIKAHFPMAEKIFAPHKMDGKLKGHGYLEFESEAVADKVMAELQNSTLCGRTVCLDYVGEKRQNSTPLKQPEENCKTLCVKQLNYKTTSEQLKAFFKKATEARIVNDTKTEKSKGFGFVVFDSHEHAAKALQNMQGKDLNGRNMVVSYALKKKSKPGKTKKDSESKKKSKKTFSKGSKNVKGGKPTKNRPTEKVKKVTNNKSKKAVDGDSS